MKIDYDMYSEILKALSHPVRLKIVELILENGRCVNDIGNALNISQAVVSHHLSILRNRKILIRQRQGAESWYTVNCDLTKEIISFIINER
jgi:DNA-binding transcriptional ArsR family regulator